MTVLCGRCGGDALYMDQEAVLWCWPCHWARMGEGQDGGYLWLIADLERALRRGERAMPPPVSSW